MGTRHNFERSQRNKREKLSSQKVNELPLNGRDLLAVVVSSGHYDRRERADEFLPSSLPSTTAAR